VGLKQVAEVEQSGASNTALQPNQRLGGGWHEEPIYRERKLKVPHVESRSVEQGAAQALRSRRLHQFSLAHLRATIVKFAQGLRFPQNWESKMADVVALAIAGRYGSGLHDRIIRLTPMCSTHGFPSFHKIRKCNIPN
jgi:hypothetical protein